MAFGSLGPHWVNRPSFNLFDVRFTVFAHCTCLLQFNFNSNHFSSALAARKSVFHPIPIAKWKLYSQNKFNPIFFVKFYQWVNRWTISIICIIKSSVYLCDKIVQSVFIRYSTNCHSDRVVFSVLSVKRNFQCELSVILSHINLFNSDKILYNHILLLPSLFFVRISDFTLICIFAVHFQQKWKCRVSLSVFVSVTSLPLTRASGELSVVVAWIVMFHLNGIEIQCSLHEWHWKGDREERRRHTAFDNLH